MSHHSKDEGSSHLTPRGRAIARRKEREGAQLLTRVNGTVDEIRKQREQREHERRDGKSE